MFHKLIEFFAINTRMNYLLFFLIFGVGIYSYQKTPKEIFPVFDLDQIIVTGAYSGASLDVMDKMAVDPLEDELKNIDDIDEMTSVITSGRYTIVLELRKGVDPYNSLDKVKDALALASRTLPSDMDEPTVRVMTIQRDLLNIVIQSNSLSTDALKDKANELKDQISTLRNISEVTIYGDSDVYYDVKVDASKVQAFGLSMDSITKAIAKLSYIFPVGLVEDKENGFFFVSTANSKNTSEKFANAIINVGGKQLRLKDVATIKKRYEDAATLFKINSKDALNLLVKQNENGNALEIADDVGDLLAKFNKQNANITTFIYDDNSEKIRDRLNIVISNILFGLIIIFFLVAFLINFRMAAIIAIGIPTSFVIGAFYFYLSGYTINMISLVGVLIALGIIVDDAIVVSENIQQKLEAGLPIKEATIEGAKEMAEPVVIASITTIFAFIPALMISGTMGEVIKLIPIAVSALVIASLIESFIFLPIHASHLLQPKSTTRSWEPINRIYSQVIHFHMHYKKFFLITFMVITPILIVVGMKLSKFQMFPKFDATNINIALKADVNTSLEDMNTILGEIQKELMSKKEEFYIQHIGSVAGFRRDSASNTENYPYVGDITIVLQKLKADNVVDKFITPYLSFYYDSENRTREEKSSQISQKLKKFLDKKDFKKRFNLVDISIVQAKVGPIKSDVTIGLVSNNNEKVIQAINGLKEKIGGMQGVMSVTDNIQFGIDEIKLSINPYGEQLGLDESTIGALLSNFYLSKINSNTFDDIGLLEIKIESNQKDNFEALKNFQITLSDGSVVALKEVVDFKIVKSFEKLTKDNAQKNFYLFANVDADVITGGEVLEALQDDLSALKKEGIKIVLKGEKEKKEELKQDMLFATGLAMVLIMLSLIYLFNSFRETFMMLSVIPYSILGVLIGHAIMGLNLSMPSFIGMLGLAGVVINDGIIMIVTLKKAKDLQDIYRLAASRLRPIILTSVTTLVGLMTIIFFPTGQAVIFQPLAISLGFGLAWGTVLNLIYLPVLYTFINKKRLHAEGY
ncbi:MAG: efflux RND transporter permease subunit [Campylobacterales bacterium]|nr:efflux RND transporter permease subunit [Campylobacterales bacterium]